MTFGKQFSPVRQALYLNQLKDPESVTAVLKKKASQPKIKVFNNKPVYGGKGGNPLGGAPSVNGDVKHMFANKREVMKVYEPVMNKSKTLKHLTYGSEQQHEKPPAGQDTLMKFHDNLINELSPPRAEKQLETKKGSLIPTKTAISTKKPINPILAS